MRDNHVRTPAGRLDTLLGEVEAFARKTLISAPPETILERFCIMVNAAGQRAVVECAWNDADERRRMLRALRLTLREVGAVAYCIASEAWAASYSGATIRPEVMPEARPDRQEVVIAVAANRRAHAFKSWAIVRDEAGRVIELTLQGTPEETRGDLTELLQ